MERLFAFIKKLFTYRSPEEIYLSNAIDHFDLEQRIRKLDRGQVHTGPFGYKEKYYRY